MFRRNKNKDKRQIDEGVILKELEKLLEATAYRTTSGLMAYQEAESYEKIKRFIKEK